MQQKYYLHFNQTGEHGAVYLWDALHSLEGFRLSDLARSIPGGYLPEPSEP